MKVVSRAVLVQALIQYSEDRLAALPETNETFSPAHERRMAKLFARSEKPYYRFVSTRGKRLAVVLIAVLVSMTITVSSVSALREGFVNFVVNVYEKFSQVFVPDTGEAYNNYPATIEVKYAPQDIPEGYVLTETIDFPIKYQLHYVNALNDIPLVFEQGTVMGSSHRIDTEGVPAEKVMVGEVEALMYHNKNICNIIWTYQNYWCWLSGADDLDLLKIATSLAPS